MTRPRLAPVLHPTLFAAFPVLSLWGHNVSEVSFKDALFPLIASIGAATAVLLLGTVGLRDMQRGGIATSALVLLFFSYGHVATGAEHIGVGDLSLGRPTILLPAWGLLAVSSIVMAARVRRPDVITKLLHALAVGLVATSAITIGVSERGSGTAVVGAVGPELRAHAFGARTPDIYYLIFDRYAGDRTLREMYGFDNGPFLRRLRDMGFYVARESRAPYPNTALSLAASLNMSYLESLSAQADQKDWAPAHELLQRNAVVGSLKNQGYRYVHIGTWWEPTRRNPLADINFVYQPLSEFADVLLRSTIAKPLAGLLGREDRLDSHRTQYDRVHFQYRKLLETRSMAGPKFVFAHFTLPHDPYVFDRHGRFVPRSEQRARSRVVNYLEQLRYTNDLIIDLLEELLASPQPPVVIVQSDEGPKPESASRQGFTWRNASEHDLKEKFRILNAYYFPDGARGTELRADTSPVNSFRIVFNRYFGQDLAMLPEESYIFPTWHQLYTFVRVTDRVRS